MGTSAFEILVVPIVWGAVGSSIAGAAILAGVYAPAGLVERFGGDEATREEELSPSGWRDYGAE